MQELEKFENPALFIRLDLPFTLICHGNGAFLKAIFKPEEFEKAGFLWMENIWKRGKTLALISLTKFSSNKNQNWPVIVAFLNSSGVVWTENTWYVFRVKHSFSNFPGVVDGNWGSETNCGRISWSAFLLSSVLSGQFWLHN